MFLSSVFPSSVNGSISHPVAQTSHVEASLTSYLASLPVGPLSPTSRVFPGSVIFSTSPLLRTRSKPPLSLTWTATNILTTHFHSASVQSIYSLSDLLNTWTIQSHSTTQSPLMDSQGHQNRIAFGPAYLISFMTWKLPLVKHSAHQADQAHSCRMIPLPGPVHS